MADSLFAMQPTPRLELRMYESNNTTSDGHKSCAKETRRHMLGQSLKQCQHATMQQLDYD